MTVYDLMEKHKALRQASKDVETAMSTMNRVFNTMSEKCQTSQEKDTLRENTNDIVMTLSTARTWLQWCEDLLQNVARETEIPWPPFGLKRKED